MDSENTDRPGKIRQNISIDEDVRDMLRLHAKKRKTTVSGLITQLAMELEEKRKAESGLSSVESDDQEDLQRKAN